MKSGIGRNIYRKIDLQVLREFRDESSRPYAIVFHDFENALISDVWLGEFGSEANFKRVLIYVCEMFETGSYTRWLADLRHLNQSFYGLEDWLSQVAFQRAAAAGMVKEAVVLPEKLVTPNRFDTHGSGTAAMNKIVDDRIRSFTSIEEATSWLLA